MNNYHLDGSFYFSATYSCGAYGAGSFDGADACQTTGATGGTPGSSVGAPDTGYAPGTFMGIGADLLVIGGLAVVVLASSAVALLRGRKHKTPKASL